MDKSRKRWLPLLIVALVAMPVVAVGLVTAPLALDSPRLAMATWTALGLGLGVVVWKLLDATLLAAVRRLAIEVAAVARGARSAPFNPDAYPFLPVLPQAMRELAARLAAARHESAAEIALRTRDLDLARARLGAVLNALSEGVVVCSVDHRVVLYNQAALRLLGLHGEIGLGRPLFPLLAEDPVRHAFDRLCREGPGPVSFIAGTGNGRALLPGRMTAIKGNGDDDVVAGYVMSFGDGGGTREVFARWDVLLATAGARIGEVAGRLAAGDMVPGEAARELTAALERTGRERALLPAGWWPMAELNSGDLFDFVLRRLSGSGLVVTVTGLPVWMLGDSHALVLLVEGLIRAVAAATGTRTFDLGAVAAGSRVWVKLVWVGPVPPDAVVDSWRAAPLGGGMAGVTVADALAHHGAVMPAIEVGEDGVIALRLGIARGVGVSAPAPSLPERPEFFDFDLLGLPPTPEMAGRPLRGLTYVVFDTETTGLAPKGGDRVVSLAGVRIVNGRILTGEVFDRLVDPERSIPLSSTRFHGITDAMVVGKPPIAVVLRQFMAFAADAVLVAHNAAFDLKFIRMQEAEAGLALANPVLDTMLLSAFVDGTAEGQSLDAIAARYGVSVTGRHSALGDSLTTAAVLLCLIEALEAKGVRTLGDALEGLDMTLELHNRMLTLS